MFEADLRLREDSLFLPSTSMIIPPIPSSPKLLAQLRKKQHLTIMHPFLSARSTPQISTNHALFLGMNAPSTTRLPAFHLPSPVLQPHPLRPFPTLTPPPMSPLLTS